MDITTAESGLEEIIDFVAISDEYKQSQKIEDVLEKIDNESFEFSLEDFMDS